jgi:hypothetical protein
MRMGFEYARYKVRALSRGHLSDMKAVRSGKTVSASGSPAGAGLLTFGEPKHRIVVRGKGSPLASAKGTTVTRNLLSAAFVCFAAFGAGLLGGGEAAGEFGRPGR